MKASMGTEPKIHQKQTNQYSNNRRKDDGEQAKKTGKRQGKGERARERERER
eukprot:CAMPEP_0167771860 /NCGR_PEP_ID=MMETSP0111_2-20121227/517_1 /TAXON_ID=91324 /ORGANISM="Lotharella globosa, Strain CCCM811" /LENGTH=51 /DNA_ID=CAMNT_0007661269 /DNA_START=647 /DNA_END=799 /DNA_ORIENTATION=+